MKCVMCSNGETEPGTTTFLLDHDYTTFVIEDVPAEVCQQCGEGYVDEATTEQLTQQVAEAAGNQVCHLLFARTQQNKPLISN